MPSNTRGYAAQSPTAPIAPFSFTRRDLRADDVAIDILYCGICPATRSWAVSPKWART